MLGDQDHLGIIPRAMQQIFDSIQKLEKDGWTYTMQVSMLEIYNEDYRDLLAPKAEGGTAGGPKHQVIHNADGTATVTDLTVVDISQPSRRSRNFNGGGIKGGKKGAFGLSGTVSRKGLSTALPARVDALLAEAMAKRSVGLTALNEQSSRSHMVFTMKLNGVNESRGKKAVGVLNLIDLAGSERVKESGSTGIRLKEAQAINSSLSALGECKAHLFPSSHRSPLHE